MCGSGWRRSTCFGPPNASHNALAVGGMGNAVELKLPVGSAAVFISRYIQARDQLGKWQQKSVEASRQPGAQRREFSVDRGAHDLSRAKHDGDCDQFARGAIAPKCLRPSRTRSRRVLRMQRWQIRSPHGVRTLQSSRIRITRANRSGSLCRILMLRSCRRSERSVVSKPGGRHIGRNLMRPPLNCSGDACSVGVALWWVSGIEEASVVAPGFFVVNESSAAALYGLSRPAFTSR